jgi:hypothetical protein
MPAKLAVVSNKSVTHRPTLKLTQMDKLALAVDLMLDSESDDRPELIDQIGAYSTKLKSSPIMRRFLHRHIEYIQGCNNLEPRKNVENAETYLAHCIALLRIAEKFTLSC